MGSYRTLSRFYRTVSAIPEHKKLIHEDKVLNEGLRYGDQIGDICPEVTFSLAEKDGRKYWAKLWHGKRQPLQYWTLEVERALSALGRSDFSLAVDVNQKLGLIYNYDPDLFDKALIVHQWDVRRYLGQSANLSTQKLASVYLPIAGTRAPLGQLTDFQAAVTRRGLIFLDFEVSWYWAKRLIED